MKINGYWLGLGLLSLLDYAYLLFKPLSYNIITATITGGVIVISFGLAIEKEKKC